MSLRGAKRRGNPFPLQHSITKRSTQGKFAATYEFAQTAGNLSSISAGKRIATSRGSRPAPRNDMQKTEALLRLQEGGKQ